MTSGARILIGAIALLMVPAVAQSGERGRDAKGDDWSYDYNVPLALPPYGYTPGFWGYGGKRYYDKFGNYRKYQEPGGLTMGRSSRGRFREACANARQAKWPQGTPVILPC